MNRRLIICIAILCSVVSNIHAQDDAGYTERVNQYVAKYKGLAMEEQKRCGMPAAVILAQAILETEAGSSELVKGANNHFGIKCKTGWKGETFTHTDDKEDECFRKYKTVLESYKDHSDYLKNTPRYASLFKLSVTDYAAWAIGLKQCGYATNPIYAQKLIGFIEDYHLQEYTYAVLNSKSNSYSELIAQDEKERKDTLRPKIPVSTPIDTFAFKKIKKAKDTMLIAKVADSATQKMASFVKKDSTYSRAITNIPVNQTIVKQADTVAVIKDTVSKTILTKTDTGGQVPANINATAAANSLKGTDSVKKNSVSKTLTMHGLKAFYAHKGDMLLEAAVKYNIRYAKLLEINDLPDAPLEKDMYIYLEKKPTEGTHPSHIVQSGETLQEISQIECIQLKRLMAYNDLEPGDMPAVGAKLFLKQVALKKPPLVNANAPHKNISVSADTVNKAQTKIPDNYITKPATEETPLPVSPAAPVAMAAPASGNGADDTIKAPGSLSESQQDKLTQLKSKLDKVVYSADTLAPVEAMQAAQMQQGNTETPQAAQPEQARVIKIVSDSANYYTVKDGDTIYNIAHRFNITMRQLNSWNNLDPDSGIKKGMKLKVKE